MAKGGSKVLTAVLSFIIGFLFAIIVEVGAVVGVYFFVTTQNLDTVLETFGLDNRDDDGNFLYVNTDKASTVGELLDELNVLFLADGPTTVTGKTMNDIEELLPLVNSITEKVYAAVGEYIDVDWDEFENTPFTEVLPFLQECVMDARIADVLEKLDMGDLVGEDANVLIRTLLAGIETEYAYTETGLKFPVYYDVYNYDEQLNAYYREHAVDGIDAYPDGLDTKWLYEHLTENEDGKTDYLLYYVPCKLTEQGIEDADFEYYTYEWTEADELGSATDKHRTVVKYAEGTVYVVVEPDSDGNFKNIDLADLYEDLTENEGKNSLYYDAYGASYYGNDYTDCTGHYYYTNGGEKVRVNPITVNSIVSDAFAPLDYIPVTDVVGDDDIIVAIFGKSSVGDLVSAGINFDDAINKLELSAVVDIDPEQAIMAYLGYGLTSVEAAPDGSDYQYTAKVRVEEDGEQITKDCYVVAQDGFIKEVYYLDGDDKVYVSATTVGEVSSRIDGLMDEMSLSDIVDLDVKATDGIMAYIGYGLSDVVKAPDGADYDYTATYNESVNADGEDGIVKHDCYITVDDESGIILSVWYYDGETKVEVPATTVNEISSRLDNIMDCLALPDLIDIKADDAILAYVGYGITGVRAESGDGYNYVGYVKIDGQSESVRCYISADENSGKILSVWYKDGDATKPVYGTKVSGLSDRVSKLTDELALADVIDVKADSSIMAYIGYGLSDVVKAPDTVTGYDYTATYKERTDTDADGDGNVDIVEHKCYITVDENEIILSVWYYDGETKVEVPATTINGVTDKIDTMTDDLVLGDIIDIDENSNKILRSLKDTSIGGIGDEITSLTVSDIFEEEDIEGNSILKQLRNTTIVDLADDIDTVVIQRIYPEEIYGLPEGYDEPMEVVAFDENATYYYELGTDTDESNNSKTAFVLVHKGTESEGELTLEEFKNRGNKTYFVQDESSNVYKIVGYYVDTDNSIKGFSDSWLFYEKNEKGEYVLTEKNATSTEGTTSSDDLGRLNASDINATDSDGKTTTYYSYGSATGMWKLILSDKGKEKAYTLKNFSDMVDVCANNVYNATLGELQDAGIIEVGTDLNNCIKCYTIKDNNSTPTVGYIKVDDTQTDGYSIVDNTENGTPMKDFTLKQLLNVIIKCFTGTSSNATTSETSGN